MRLHTRVRTVRVASRSAGRAAAAAARRPVPGAHRTFKPKPRPPARARVWGRSRTAMRLALSRRLLVKGTLLGGPDDVSEASVVVSGTLAITAIRAAGLRNREVFGKQVGGRGDTWGRTALSRRC
jgi:hypothetical protein